MGRVVTYSVTLQPFSAIILFDQGFDASLVGAPQGVATPSGNLAPSSVGGNGPQSGGTLPPKAANTNAGLRFGWGPELLLLAVTILVVVF
jgi:hypothetical protein